MYGLFQPQPDGRKVNGRYAAVAADLKARMKRKGNERLQLPYLLATVLSRKGDLPTQLRAAYRRGDKAALRKYSKVVIPRTVEDIKALNAYHRDLWHGNNKPFGWEILERRYGGLLGVFDNLQQRLGAWLAGEVQRLEEFEADRVKLWNMPYTDIPTTGALRMQGTGHIYH